VADDLMLRSLAEDEWPEAMRLAARSFLNEPFLVEMFGAEPVRRFALANEFYRSSAWHDDQQHLAALVGDLLVGFCVCSPPGRCRICSDTDPQRRPDDQLQVSEWQFEVNVQAAHADHGAHAWISRVAVDPVLRGTGIGRTLMSQAIAQVRTDGAELVLLECQPHRENFYLACSSNASGRFPTPSVPRRS
jgi:ribosomal protein S18 acetylase RimI-like enzyme